MKLVRLVVASILSVAGVASAQPADPYAAPPPPPAAVRPGALRAELLARFDRNHDGRLERGERRHAIRALRRLARQLARQERRMERQAGRMRGVIQRYDMDGDGNVGPGEMPPAMARKLRRLDRNGDGWVDDADF